jgi:GGDEF domain-containing protein
MGIRVEMPDGNFIEFPEGTSTKVMSKAGKDYMASKPKEPNYGDIALPVLDQSAPKADFSGVLGGTKYGRKSTKTEKLQGGLLDLASGIVGGAKVIPDVVQLTNRINPMVRASDYVTNKARELTPFQGAVPYMKSPTELTQMAQDFLRKGSTAADELKPQAYRDEQKQPILLRDKAGNVTGFDAPGVSQVFGAILQSVPQIPAMLLGGEIAALPKLAQSAPKLAAFLQYGTSNAAIISAQQRDDTYKEALAEDTAGALANLYSSGVTPTARQVLEASEAAKVSANQKADVSAALTAPMAFMTGGLGGASAKAFSKTSGSLLGAAVKGAVAEAPLEGIESTGQAIINDIANERAIDYVSAADQGVLGMFAGGLPGAAVSAKEYIGQKNADKFSAKSLKEYEEAQNSVAEIVARQDAEQSAPANDQPLDDIERVLRGDYSQREPESFQKAKIVEQEKTIESSARPQPLKEKAAELAKNLEEFKAKQSGEINQEAPAAPNETPVLNEKQAESDVSLALPTDLSQKQPNSAQVDEDLKDIEKTIEQQRAELSTPEVSYDDGEQSLDPEKRRLFEFEAKVNRLAAKGINPEQLAEVRKELDTPVERDSVTGAYTRKDYIPTIETAVKTGRKHFYIEADLGNLNGLNATVGSSSADAFLKKMYEAINESLSGLGNSVVIRKGGDEFGSVVEFDDRAAVESAMMKARDIYAQFAQEQGVSSIKATKEGSLDGTQIHFGVSELSKDENISDSIKKADILVELRKKGAGYEQQGTFETAGTGRNERRATDRGTERNGEPARQEVGRQQSQESASTETSAEIIAKEGFSTSTKNEVTDKERADRDEKSIETESSLSNDEVIRRARDIREKDKIAADVIVERLNSEGPPSISQQEEAVILVEKIELMKTRNKYADVASNKDSSDAEKRVATEKWLETEQKISKIDEAVENSGREWGRFGQFRSRMLRDDYSFEALERKERVRKGEALTKDESDVIKIMAEKISEAQNERDLVRKELEEALEKLNVQLTYDQIVKDIGAKPVRRNKTATNVFDLTKLRENAEKAREALSKVEGVKSKNKQAGAVIDPRAIVYATQIGAYNFANGFNKFATFSKQMAIDLGEAYVSLKDSINDIFRASKKIAESSVLDNTAIDPEKLTHKDVYNVALKIIKSGVRGENSVMQATHAEIKKVIPTITEREVRVLFSEYGKAKFPTKDADKKEARQIRALVQMQESIDRLATGLPALKSGVQRDEQSLLVRQKRKQLNAILKKLESKVPVAAKDRLKSYQEARVKNIANQIQDIEDQIKTGRRDVKLDAPTPSAEMLKLIAQRDALKAERDLIDKGPKKTKEQSYQEARGKSLDARLKEVERRIRENDYSKVIRPEPKKLNEKNTVKELALKKAKETFLQHQFYAEMAKRGPISKAFGAIGESLNLSRAILTSFDLSAVGRQGFLLAAPHPILAMKAMPAMFKAFWDEKYQLESTQKITERENYPLYKKAGLELTTDDGYTLRKMEENFASRWIDHIPKIVGGGLVRGSNRAYSTFLNQIRADVFDTLKETLTKDARNPTLEESKAIANFINIATGRGTIGSSKNAGEFLNAVFFAPRLVASRFNYLLAQPIIGKDARAGGKNVQMLIAREYGRTMIGIMALMGLGYMFHQAGDSSEEEFITFDPTTTDFGKMKFGNTRLDILAGLSQVIAVSGRVITGETTNADGFTRATRDVLRPLEYFRDPLERDSVEFGKGDGRSVVTNFMFSKMSPIISTIFQGVQGKDYEGRDVTMTSLGTGLVIPMGFGNIAKIIEDDTSPVGYSLAKSELAEDRGVSGATAMKILEVFGTGVMVYGDFESAENEAGFTEYEKLLKKVDKIKDTVKKDISALPDDEIDAALEKLQKENPEILADVAVERYVDNKQNRNLDRAGTPKREKDGTLRLSYKNFQENGESVMGELGGYTYYDPYEKKQKKTEGAIDKIKLLSKAIKEIQSGKSFDDPEKEMTLEDVSTLVMGFEEPMPEGDKVTEMLQKNPEMAGKLAGGRVRRAVVEELKAVRLQQKKKAIEVSKGIK